MQKPGYVDVDELQARTSLADAAAKCGVTLDAKGTGPEVRIDCPFHCLGDHAGRKELAINVENPQKVFQCHAYSCKFRGNLLTLMHGWLTGSKPSGEKLKGVEFQRVKNVLAGSVEGLPSPAKSPTATAPTSPHSEVQDDPTTVAVVRNVPFIESPDEKLRELHNIDEKFITDVAAMSPAAASYVRRHPSLSPESMKKWRCGYLPNDGGGDKRGWSLRGNIIYPAFSEDGKVLAWVGRDVNYDEKELTWSRLFPVERQDKDAPAKHRFPKGFQRGQELFGQQSSRLKEPGYRDFIAQHGILVVEGFNDVIQLDNLGTPSVGIMSNRITEAQVEKIVRWSKQIGNSKVTLLFDCETSGDEGAKEALWKFAERRLHVRLAWSLGMFNGEFKNRQPESLSRDELVSRLLLCSAD